MRFCWALLSGETSQCEPGKRLVRQIPGGCRRQTPSIHPRLAARRHGAPGPPSHPGFYRRPDERSRKSKEDARLGAERGGRVQTGRSPVVSIDPRAQPNPAGWKTFNCGCSISCGFRLRSTRTRLEKPPLAAVHMKAIWGFQWTTSLIGSNRVTVAKNAKVLVGRLPRHMASRSGEVMLQAPLARAPGEACEILGIAFLFYFIFY